MHAIMRSQNKKVKCMSAVDMYKSCKHAFSVSVAMFQSDCDPTA